MTFTVNQILHF